MELDWCSDESLSNFENFNENSIISKEKKKEYNQLNIYDNNNLNLNECFSIDLNYYDNKNILLVINYLSFISNHLRTSIRNKSSKFGEIKEMTLDEYNLMIKYLDWLILASNSIKNFFSVPIRRDNSFDPSSIKLFKTSSYKFCNFKESCSIHKNKQSKCDKNHFVFDMIINDIQKLKESIRIIGFDNINWTLNNKLIIITYDLKTKNYSIKNVENLINDTDVENNDYNFVIDKTLIFKSFDVISYVLNKMYEESLCFLNDNSQPSFLININV
jgi:hypothetical protein